MRKSTTAATALQNDLPKGKSIPFAAKRPIVPPKAKPYVGKHTIPGVGDSPDRKQEYTLPPIGKSIPGKSKSKSGKADAITAEIHASAATCWRKKSKETFNQEQELITEFFFQQPISDLIAELQSTLHDCMVAERELGDSWPQRTADGMSDRIYSLQRTIQFFLRQDELRSQRDSYDSWAELEDLKKQLCVKKAALATMTKQTKSSGQA